MSRMSRWARVFACAVWAAAPAARPVPPAVLEQPALSSPKALGAVMLAVARAGNRLVAVGERGTILLSDDDGKTWKQAQVPVRTSLTAAQFVANTAGTAQDASDRIVYETDTGKLFYDSNGNAAGGETQFAQLAAGLALTNNDFLIL